VIIFLWALYVLAVIGMAGVCLIPARAWSLLWRRRVRHPLPSRPLGVVLAIVAFILIAMSLLMASWVIPQVLRCLSGMGCEANSAFGLLLLAQFGAMVLVTELVWRITGFVLSRVQRSH
jgi:hypothetical protein